jgi:hypothetical protein
LRPLKNLLLLGTLAVLNLYSLTIFSHCYKPTNNEIIQ